jgi:WD40 repeat protein
MIVYEFPADPHARPGDLWYAHRLRFDPPRGRLLTWVETVRWDPNPLSDVWFVGRAFGAFDLATGRWGRLLPPTGESDGLILVPPAVSPSGNVIATGPYRRLHDGRRDHTRNRVRLLSSAGAVRELQVPLSREVADLAFSPDGRFLYGIESGVPSAAHVFPSAVARYDVSAIFSRPPAHEPPEWDVLCELPSDTNGFRVAPAPDGRVLAIGQTDGSVALWDTRTNEPLAELMCDFDRNAKEPRVNGVEELAFSPDGSRLAVVANEYAALWHLPDRSRLWRSDEPRRVPDPGTRWRTEWPVSRAIAFAPDGRTFATGDGDGTVWWRDFGGEPFRAFRWGLGEIHALAFSPDGLMCAAAASNGRVVVWDVDG